MSHFNFYVGLNLGGIGLDDADVTITVYDGRDTIAHQGTGNAALTLPNGLYTVRAEYAQEFEERIVRHTGATQVTIRPTRHAAAPLFGTATAHEYYSYPSGDISRKETDQPLGDARDEGRLFIFIRTTDQRAYQGQDLSDKLSLRKPKSNQVLTTFDDGVEKNAAGFLAYSVRAEPGMYVLEYAGVPARQMPLYVFAGWQTQVFVIHHQRPLLEGATIYLARSGDGFRADDRYAYAADMAINGLQNDRALMPREAMQTLLYGKFENPMLGLLGAHILLRQPKVERHTIEMVLGNLNYLLPGSSDVAALQILKALKLGEPIPKNISFETMPMLRAGFEAIIAADNAAEQIIPDGGWVERIAARVYTDSPWTSWEPLPAPKASPPPLPPALFNLSTYTSIFRSPLVDHAEAKSPEKDWVKDSLREAIARGQKTGQSPEIVMAKLATDFKVPLRLVKRAYTEL